MILKHVLHGSDDAVRHSLIAWQLVNMATVALLPALARRVGSLGKIFLVAMLLDGCAIALAGRFAAVPGAGLLPFVAILCADHALTNTSSSLVDLAQNSASSAGMRGRIAAAYAFVVIVSDGGAEGAATVVSERIGIPHMLSFIGFLQIVLMGAVAVIGGRLLWSFGLRSTKVGAAEAAVATSPAAAE
jgi:hypothetical protein